SYQGFRRTRVAVRRSRQSIVVCIETSGNRQYLISQWIVPTQCSDLCRSIRFEDLLCTDHVSGNSGIIGTREQIQLSCNELEREVVVSVSTRCGPNNGY